MSIAETYDEILSGLKAGLPSGTRLRVEEDMTATVGRRSVVVGPPSFTWAGVCNPDEPDAVTFDVYLIESVGEKAIPRLLRELPELITAVQTLPNALVTDARPGAFAGGSADLPCYLLTVSMDL